MRKLRRVLIVFGIFVLLFGFFFWQNNDLVLSVYDIDHGVEDEITIVHLSDLHNKMFGEDNQRLVDHVIEVEPDLIFITGDLIDQKNDEDDLSFEYIGDLRDIAPVYVSLGNHEYWADLAEEVTIALEDMGAVVLDNEAIHMNIKGHFVQLIGLSDEAGGSDAKEELINMINVDMYNIVLYHQPLSLEMFADYDVELVFSGHAHGGQTRLPLIGGLIAPGEGLFPTYTSGLYEIEDSMMVVSRGLGNSVIPVRVFNRPEIVVVKLS